MPIAADPSTQGTNGRSVGYESPIGSGRTPKLYFVTLIAAATGVDRAPLTDTLTESFCERCGTRYEFSTPTRLNPLRKTRGFVGGLRNYLTGQDALSDAMNDAMRTEEDGLAHAQLDAFHESFNFCINCRQYTCVNCWNDTAGRCRTCAPIPGTDDLGERLAASFGSSAIAAAARVAQDTPPGHLDMDVWPMSDLPIESIGEQRRRRDRLAGGRAVEKRRIRLRRAGARARRGRGRA